MRLPFFLTVFCLRHSQISVALSSFEDAVATSTTVKRTKSSAAATTVHAADSGSALPRRRKLAGNNNNNGPVGALVNKTISFLTGKAPKRTDRDPTATNTTSPTTTTTTTTPTTAPTKRPQQMQQQPKPAPTAGTIQSTARPTKAATPSSSSQRASAAPAQPVAVPVAQNATAAASGNSSRPNDYIGVVACPCHDANATGAASVMGYLVWSDLVFDVNRLANGSNSSNSAALTTTTTFTLCPDSYNAGNVTAALTVLRSGVHIECGTRTKSNRTVDGPLGAGCIVNGAAIVIGAGVKNIVLRGLELVAQRGEIAIGAGAVVTMQFLHFRGTLFPGAGTMRAAVVSAGHLLVTDSVFAGNTGRGAVFVTAQKAVFQRVQFLNNSAAAPSQDASAIHVGSTNKTGARRATVSIRDSCFDNNVGGSIVKVQLGSTLDGNLKNAVVNTRGGAKCPGVTVLVNASSAVCQAFAFRNTPCATFVAAARAPAAAPSLSGSTALDATAVPTATPTLALSPTAAVASAKASPTLAPSARAFPAVAPSRSGSTALDTTAVPTATPTLLLSPTAAVASARASPTLAPSASAFPAALPMSVGPLASAAPAALPPTSTPSAIAFPAAQQTTVAPTVSVSPDQLQTSIAPTVTASSTVLKTSLAPTVTVVPTASPTFQSSSVQKLIDRLQSGDDALVPLTGSFAFPSSGGHKITRFPGPLVPVIVAIVVVAASWQ